MAFFGNRDPRAFMPMLQAAMSGQIPGVTVEDPYAMAQALGIPSPGSFGGPPAAHDAAPGTFGGPPASLDAPPLKITYGDSSGPMADAGIRYPAPPQQPPIDMMGPVKESIYQNAMTPRPMYGSLSGQAGDVNSLPPPIDGAPLAMPDYMTGINDALAQNAAMAKPKKSGGFGGFLKNFAGYLGDSLTGNPVYADSLKHKRRLEEIDRETQRKANLPQQVGGTIVVPDGQGGYRMLYRAPSTAEDYALAQGYRQGTEEFSEAVRQYRLGSWNDEAAAARQGLSGFNFDRRGELQDDRQTFSREQQEDRQTNSNSQLNRRLNAPPRQRPDRPRPPTPMSVIGRLMDKQAAGKPLTPAEQRTYDEYRAGRGRGSRANSAGDLVGSVYQKGGRRIQYSKKAGGYIDLATGQRVQ